MGMGTMKKEHHITDFKLYSCRCLIGINNGNISYRILNLMVGFPKNSIAMDDFVLFCHSPLTSRSPFRRAYSGQP